MKWLRLRVRQLRSRWSQFSLQFADLDAAFRSLVVNLAILRCDGLVTNTRLLVFVDSRVEAIQLATLRMLRLVPKSTKVYRIRGDEDLETVFSLRSAESIIAVTSTRVFVKHHVAFRRLSSLMDLLIL